MKLSRSVLEWLIFGDPGGRRYTQDSPVLPDVWIGYGQHPGERLELLLTPHRRATPGEVAVVLRRLLGLGERGAQVAEQGHQIAYSQSSVAAALNLEELVRHVFPMTQWWNDRVWKIIKDLAASAGGKKGLAKELARRLAELDQDEREPERRRPRKPGEKRIPAPALFDVLWMMRIVGWLAWAQGKGEQPPDPEEGRLREWRLEHGPKPQEVVTALFELVGNRLPDPVDEPGATIHQVNRNRPAHLAVAESRLAVKADAAERLFEIRSSKLAWAIIDTGIDATHKAFRRLKPDGKPYKHPFGEDPKKPHNRTRVVATYDFTRVRRLLNPANLDPGNLPEDLADLGDLIAGASERAVRLRDQLEDLRKRLQFGREVDWELLEPFLEVPHDYDRYWLPTNDHGTHVAGILAAHWQRTGANADPEEEGRYDHDLLGICPDIRLYDFRVLPRGGGGPDDEFNVIAALQFVRHLNLQKNHQVIHGVNLSLSIPHEVANFACGRTPVCEECERLVGSGVVVVAAAGNNGYLRYQTAQGEQEGYHTISITDPGNAASVITVGATHRNRPHTYGVSYFSSRGPTGDGRIKPDLVAPGEKITAPTTDGGEGEKDGTSMAAPHVSGAAAMLMARYRELIGRPQEIKRILCDSATDLGRERYFQGHGMLDILRALQSV